MMPRAQRVALLLALANTTPTELADTLGAGRSYLSTVLHGKKPITGHLRKRLGNYLIAEILESE